jgi:hypothetical protein
MKNPLSNRFLLNYEAKGWSKAKFFYISEIVIYRLRWRYHWFTPRQWKQREITPPYSNTSLCFFHWSQAAELPIRSSQVFKDPALSLTRYSRFNHHTEQSSSLWFANIKTFSCQLFSYSWRGSGIELDPSGGSPRLAFRPLACCFRGKQTCKNPAFSPIASFNSSPLKKVFSKNSV